MLTDPTRPGIVPICCTMLPFAILIETRGLEYCSQSLGTFFGPKFFLDPQFFWTQILFLSKIYLNPKVFDPKFFGPKFFRAERSVEVFREQKLVIFPFLSFFIQTVYIPPNVGQDELRVFELWATQSYATGTGWEIFTEHKPEKLSLFKSQYRASISCYVCKQKATCTAQQYA